MAPTNEFRFVSASSVDLLYDDSDRDVFTFSTSRAWTVFPDLQWLGGTATVLGGEGTAGNNDEELLTVTYRGGGISLYGLAPSPAEGQRFRFSVNGQEPVEAIFGGSWSSSSPSPSPSSSDSTSTPLPSSSNATAPLSYGMWYSIQASNTSSDARSTPTTVKFYDLPAGLSVDYAKVVGNIATGTITVPVIVDDTDAEIVYSNSWTQTQDPFTLAGKSQVEQVDAYGGGVHVCRQVGETVQLNFYGSSIKVFGLLASGAEGMTVSYTVDRMQPQVMRYGSSITATSSSSSSPITTENGGGNSATPLEMVSMQNYELFSSGPISGDVFHSLLINVTSIQSSSSSSPSAGSQQGLVIDYFTYEPLRRDYEELATYASGMAYDSSKVTPKFTWVLVAVFVALGVVLVLGSFLRIFLKRRPEVVRRLAQTVRLDLEFSFNNARKFLRSTILDIRPQTPPPAPPPASGSAAQSDDPSRAASASAPGSSSAQNPSPERQAQVQELWSIIAYLSRINTRLMSAVGAGRSNTVQGSSSIGGQSRRQSLWGIRSRGGTDSEAPPPYQV